MSEDRIDFDIMTPWVKIAAYIGRCVEETNNDDLIAEFIGAHMAMQEVLIKLNKERKK